MPLEPFMKWGLSRGSAVRCLGILAAALIIPACTGGSQNKAAPPVFGGLLTATPGAPGQIVLTWSPAVDFAGGGITYHIFATNTGVSGSEMLIDTSTSPTGATTSAFPGGFQSGNTYLMIVQAVDSLGQSDGNSVEKSVIAP
jgi:hypothetical protein